MAGKRRLSVPQRSPKPPPSSARSPNRLLAALPIDIYDRLLASIQLLPLPHGLFLHRKGERIDHVYFPGGGVCSLVMPMKDGSMVEVATVGKEGVVGGSAALEGSVASETAMVQIPFASAERLTAKAFRVEMDRRGAFFDLLARSAQSLASIVMQSCACNARHTAEQRLARWLLMAHDRVGADEFPLTQEFVAMMLGTSRPTVTIVAGTLQKAGLIEYRHGRITVVSRRNLEQASCECYAAVSGTFDESLRPVSSAKPKRRIGPPSL